MTRQLHTPGGAATEPVAESTEAAKPANKSTEAAKELSRADYASMQSSEVDPTTLSRAVLCKDGWVTPLPRDKEGKPITDLLRKPGAA